MYKQYLGKGLLILSLLLTIILPTKSLASAFGTTSGTTFIPFQHMIDTYMTATPNGNFGQATLAAVKEYQKANNLPQDGIIGKLTRSILNK
jgi:peptidoglycan hydrolase-like protein with peptidoglycan-binding domain